MPVPGFVTTMKTVRRRMFLLLVLVGLPMTAGAQTRTWRISVSRSCCASRSSPCSVPRSGCSRSLRRLRQ